MADELQDQIAELVRKVDKADWERFAAATWSGLVQLLPGGALFNAWTAGVSREREVDEALALVASCLKELGEGHRSEQIMNRVTSSLEHYLRTFERVFLEHLDVSNKMHDEILSVLRLIAPPPQTCSATLFLVSGPSAAGKDVVVASVLTKLRERGFASEYLRKYTTRTARPGESEGDSPYYDYRTNRQFQGLVDRGDIAFEYSKYGFRYGFGQEQIEACLSGKTPAFSIISDFPNVGQRIGELRDRGLRVVPILVYAPAEDCRRRMPFRNLAPGEVRDRIQEMEADCRFIEGNPDEIRRVYDMQVRNDDWTAFNEASNGLFRFVASCLLTDMGVAF